MSGGSQNEGIAGTLVAQVVILLVDFENQYGVSCFNKYDFQYSYGLCKLLGLGPDVLFVDIGSSSGKKSGFCSFRKDTLSMARTLSRWSHYTMIGAFKLLELELGVSIPLTGTMCVVAATFGVLGVIGIVQPPLTSPVLIPFLSIPLSLCSSCPSGSLSLLVLCPSDSLCLCLHRRVMAGDVICLVPGFHHTMDQMGLPICPRY